MDAVLLSGFVTVKRGEKVTDLCTGTGIIPLLLSAKTEASQIDGIEIQPEMADMARRSVMMNGLEDRVRIICGDLREAGAAGERESRDVVTCNPPYMAAGSGIVNPEDVKALARHEVTCTLEDAVRETARLLRNGGRTAWVYRPNRLSELFACFRQYHLEPKRLKPGSQYGAGGSGQGRRKLPEGGSAAGGLPEGRRVHAGDPGYLRVLSSPSLRR